MQRGQKRRRHKLKKKQIYQVRRFVGKVPVKNTGYVMEYRLLFDKIFQISKNRFNLQKEPKIEITPTKTQDLRDEFSSYCGQKKTIKNWLFYV